MPSLTLYASVSAFSVPSAKHGGSTTTRRIGRHVLGSMYRLRLARSLQALSSYPDEIISLYTTARLIRASWRIVCWSKQNLRYEGIRRTLRNDFGGREIAKPSLKRVWSGYFWIRLYAYARRIRCASVPSTQHKASKDRLQDTKRVLNIGERNIVR